VKIEQGHITESGGEIKSASLLVATHSEVDFFEGELFLV